MTRKHFKQIADGLKSIRPEDNSGLMAWQDCVREMASVCARHNERFDRDKFYEACGMTTASHPH